MTSISASTVHKVKVSKPMKSSSSGTTKKGSRSSSSKSGQKPRGTAPRLQPRTLKAQSEIDRLLQQDWESQGEEVRNLVRRTFGERGFADGIAKPHRASSTQDRGFCAADVAMAAKTLGVVKVLKEFKVLNDIESALIPDGIGVVFGNEKGTNPGGGMKRIASACSLSSMNSNSSWGTGGGGASTTDSKRGKTTPMNAREGSLLLLRALCEICGREAEAYVVPLLAAALDESWSSNSAIRDAASDACQAIIALAHPLAAPHLVIPVLFEALHSPEWRVKENALNRLAQLATTAPLQISTLLPTIIPKVTDQLWDTKTQVAKAAADTLLKTVQTNPNPDIKPAIPAIVNAIVKPAETSLAIDQLINTTFVSPVNAPTLALLCPVLARGLKEKIALQKRNTCVVIDNMSRLVSSPDDVAPFGPLLVPELKNVVSNVQFEEIRDVALDALRTLTKALGHASIEDAVSSLMNREAERVEEEQRRIEEQRADEANREAELLEKEEMERALWKEAMEAQRLLDQMAEKEEEEKKAEEQRKKELLKQSTKSKTGKCHACGLKKCKKTCLFYSSK